MEIDFEAFYNHDDGTPGFCAGGSLPGALLHRRVKQVLDELRLQSLCLTAEQIRGVTGVRIQIQIGKGYFGWEEPPGGAAAEEPPSHEGHH